jgi:hypothetical protein
MALFTFIGFGSPLQKNIIPIFMVGMPVKYSIYGAVL